MKKHESSMYKHVSWNKLLLFIYGAFEGFCGLVFLLNSGSAAPVSSPESMVMAQMLGIAVFTIAYLSIRAAFISNKKLLLTALQVFIIYNALLVMVLLHCYLQYHLTARIFGGLPGIFIHTMCLVFFTCSYLAQRY